MQNFTQGIIEYTRGFRKRLVNTGGVEGIGNQYSHIRMVAVVAVVAIGYISHASQMTVSSVTLWVTFISLSTAIYMLVYYNHRYKAELAVSGQKLAEANHKLAEAGHKLEEQALELKRSNQDIEQLAYIVSHDLKAPVRNISSFMKLLSSRYAPALPNDGREFINMSLTGAERLGTQIDDMLSYCRVNRNLPPVADVDLNEIVRTISMELSSKISDANAAIVVERGLPLLKGVHSAMIYNVLQHLVSNGIKFNENPNPEVRIDYAEEGDMVRFSVADNGIGIGEGYEGKLFQMFKRLHTHDKYAGNGIGLAICKKIINQYKGEIGYKSAPGQGTTFYFTLPKHLVSHAMPKFTELTPGRNPVSVAA